MYFVAIVKCDMSEPGIVEKSKNRNLSRCNGACSEADSHTTNKTNISSLFCIRLEDT